MTASEPPGRTSARRQRSSRLPDLHAVAHEYAERRLDLLLATDRFVELVTTILDEAGINYLSVTGRTKSVASFAAKAARTVEGGRVFLDPLQEISDQIGIRVITYVQRDVQAVVDLLSDQMLVHEDRDMGRETAQEGRFGYASRHLLISLDPGATPAAPDLPVGYRAQVQIRTVLQHAWAEFEHDIRYKGAVPPEHVNDLDRRFTLAAGLLELADQQFSAIRDRLREGAVAPHPEPEDDDPRISPRELAAFLTGQYADAGWSRTDHYAWMCGLVLELGITSLAELSETLRQVDEEVLGRRMGYRHPTGAVRRLDDALLWAFGETYLGLHGNSHRTIALGSRLAKMREAV
jgi:ppGpp synthetase/RelA/SpoT-type nucleotidyltranferase